MTSASSVLKKINHRISDIKFGKNPYNLYEPIRYIMSLGGKRMRPILVLLTYQLKNKDIDQVLDPSLAVEVFHNFTLMHDDIMDKAPLRRGYPTVHAKWNETIAILSGDAMLVKAYDLLLKVRPEIIGPAISYFNNAALQVCEGQQIDMDYELSYSVSEVDYLEMIRLKTAVLIGFCMKLGGFLSGSDQLEELYKIGEILGTGFQLMDDYLDVYADKEKFGKRIGGDIISNKKTFLLIKAIELAKGTAKTELNRWLTETNFDEEEKVKNIKYIYEDLKIPQITKQKMEGYFDKCLKLFEIIKGEPQSKKELIGFVELLMNRKN